MPLWSRLNGKFQASLYVRPDFHCLLQQFPSSLPLGPKPCLLEDFHEQTSQHDKGTDDHLFPFCNWFPSTKQSTVGCQLCLGFFSNCNFILFFQYKFSPQRLSTSKLKKKIHFSSIFEVCSMCILYYNLRTVCFRAIRTEIWPPFTKPHILHVLANVHCTRSKCETFIVI